MNSNGSSSSVAAAVHHVNLAVPGPGVDQDLDQEWIRTWIEGGGSGRGSRVVDRGGVDQDVDRGGRIKGRGSRGVDRRAWIEECGSRGVDRGVWIEGRGSRGVYRHCGELRSRRSIAP